ncbi:MAG: hypothetical protein HYT40_00090 [Candidatus Sungbacteria bacterium]|uniref:DUF218 domain-containing protein n=1 Tax=Candidatus Sungiibacteriota bacterium TaxID=2750080 RepID=A0A931WNR1_9BACT|nr:hypothetical protein [Candidatus Sungbacteria bacterium]
MINQDFSFAEALKIFSAEELEALVKLQVLVQADTGPANTSVLYLFGQTTDNEQSVLKSSADLLRAGIVKMVAIPDGKNAPGYAGYSRWADWLLEQGFPRPYRVLVTVGNLNTFSEAGALVREAKEQGWQDIFITASPFHQLRVFISTVSVALSKYPQLRAWNRVGAPLDWAASARHSQGVLVGSRTSFVASEWARIARYHKKGDLLPPSEVLSYALSRQIIRSSGD